MSETFGVTRVSQLSREEHTMQFPAAMKARINDWLAAKNPPFAQDAFPDLDADHREFLMTGITPEEWDAAMGPEPE